MEELYKNRLGELAHPLLSMFSLHFCQNCNFEKSRILKDYKCCQPLLTMLNHAQGKPVYFLFVRFLSLLFPCTNFEALFPKIKLPFIYLKTLLRKLQQYCE